MSSPEQGESRTSGADEAPDGRHLTVIVVPHGDLETRSFVVSYTAVKFLVGSGIALILVLAVFLAFLFPILAQAARVPALERDLARLEAEREDVAEAWQALQEVEDQYERVRQMLGADAVLDGDSVPILPPLRADTTAALTPPPATDARLTKQLDAGSVRVAGIHYGQH